MSDQVICGKHGSTPATWACRHVTAGVACGFHADEASSDNPWPDAWCDLCEEALQEAGEWTDDASRVADIKALCTHCYEVARARNCEVPALARGATAQLSNDEQAALIHHAVHAIQDRQAATSERWNLGRWARWHFDDEARTLRFYDPDGTGVVAHVRSVGSYSTRSHTFQWGWKTLDANHPDVADLIRVRTFGEVRGMSQLTTANWAGDEADAWAMTALAGYLLGCEGVYRAPMDHVFWFWLLDGPRPSTVV